MKLLFPLLIVLFAFSDRLQAQENKWHPQRFSPQEFMRRQESFIIKEAGLSSYEAASFFPLYRSMGKEKFELDHKIRKLMKQAKKTGLTEAEYAGFLEKTDKLQVEKAKLETAYHQKFRKVMSAEKVLRVIEADIKFDRQILKEMVHRRPRPMNMRCDSVTAFGGESVRGF